MKIEPKKKSLKYLNLPHRKKSLILTAAKLNDVILAKIRRPSWALVWPGF